MNRFAATAVVCAWPSTSAIVNSSRATTAPFVFPESEPGSSFEWSPERTPPTACSPSASQLVLEPGPQMFEVWVTDDADNAAATHTWTIGEGRGAP